MNHKTPFIVIGSKGTVLPIELQKLKGGLCIGENPHMSWSGAKEGSLAHKVEAWIAEKREPFEIYYLNEALKEGRIKVLPVSWQKNGVHYKGTAFVKSNWNPKDDLPQYLAVDCDKWKMGAVETISLGARNKDRFVQVTIDKPLHQVTGENVNKTVIEPKFGEFYVEGKPKQVIGTVYERNPRARKECIRNNGIRCWVCNFDFEEAYGDIGKGFIHVHHEIPVADGRRYTNAVADLKPICPNCHAVLHRKKEAMKINELKKVFEKRRANSN